MTTLVVPARGTGGGIRPGAVRRPARIAGMLGLLALAVFARREAVVNGAEGLIIGTAFGVALVGIAVAWGWRPGRPTIRSIATSGGAGLAAAAALVALALIGRVHGPWVPLDPAATLYPWVQVTLLVATAEELVLRGALFDALDKAGGLTIAVGVTAIVFALLHVPLYGWQVVPLDLGVGILLGGLRVVTGGVLAPALAHGLADLAAWWL